MANQSLFARTRKPNRLLARYSDTFGEMQLRKYTERAIRAARVEADLNHRSKTAFLSTMSHELRTPLNAIIGFSDLIRQPGGINQGETREYADHIAQAGRRLLTVVSDVMDMAKLESGALALEKSLLPIGEILHGALEATKPLFEGRQQPVDVRIAKALPQIDGDAKRLRQLFGNLLSNASKFTADKGRILVMAKPTEEGGVTIAIADTGVGMTQEEIVTAIKPFAQVQDHLARLQEGTGLGLPLAMGLARLHGGELRLDSRPGAGTTAIVTLPKADVLSTTAGKVA